MSLRETHMFLHKGITQGFKHTHAHRTSTTGRATRMRMRIKKKTTNGLSYTRFCRNQGRVVGSPFTLHVGWIKRGETALRMYNHLPRR